MPKFTIPIVPTEKDVQIARASQSQLASLVLSRKESVAVQIEGHSVKVPISVAHLLIYALDELAEGRPVALIPSGDDEVSPAEAAELLRVSRPFAAKLFDAGAFPSRRVGTHRRAFTSDVLAYRERERQARLKVLDELAAEGQRLDLGA